MSIPPYVGAVGTSTIPLATTHLLTSLTSLLFYFCKYHYIKVKNMFPTAVRTFSFFFGMPTSQAIYAQIVNVHKNIWMETVCTGKKQLVALCV